MNIAKIGKVAQNRQIFRTLGIRIRLYENIVHPITANCART